MTETNSFNFERINWLSSAH